MEEIDSPEQTCPIIDRCIEKIKEIEEKSDVDLYWDIVYLLSDLEDVRISNENLRKWGHENGRACYDKAQEELKGDE